MKISKKELNKIILEEVQSIENFLLLERLTKFLNSGKILGNTIRRLKKISLIGDYRKAQNISEKVKEINRATQEIKLKFAKAVDEVLDLAAEGQALSSVAAKAEARAVGELLNKYSKTLEGDIAFFRREIEDNLFITRFQTAELNKLIEQKQKIRENIKTARKQLNMIKNEDDLFTFSYVVKNGESGLDNFMKGRHGGQKPKVSDPESPAPRPTQDGGGGIWKYIFDPDRPLIYNSVNSRKIVLKAVGIQFVAYFTFELIRYINPKLLDNTAVQLLMRGIQIGVSGGPLGRFFFGLLAIGFELYYHRSGADKKSSSDKAVDAVKKVVDTGKEGLKWGGKAFKKSIGVNNEKKFLTELYFAKFIFERPDLKDASGFQEYDDLSYNNMMARVENALRKNKLDYKKMYDEVCASNDRITASEFNQDLVKEFFNKIFENKKFNPILVAALIDKDRKLIRKNLGPDAVRKWKNDIGLNSEDFLTKTNSIKKYCRLLNKTYKESAFGTTEYDIYELLLQTVRIEVGDRTNVLCSEQHSEKAKTELRKIFLSLFVKANKKMVDTLRGDVERVNTDIISIIPQEAKEGKDC
tara:strand:+ start:1789 stop:3537 length:1749 start_codon:yes stop_codon:yes gene_type:complete